MEITRKGQADKLEDMETFFGVPVVVTEHKRLKVSERLIRNKILKEESEENILDYLRPQGVTHVNGFKIRKNNEFVSTNALLLMFNTVVAPNTLKIFYENTQNLLPVDLYIPNPFQCFNCRKFGHHASNCPTNMGSACEICGTGNNDHLTSQCKKQRNVSVVVEITRQD